MPRHPLSLCLGHTSFPPTQLWWLVYVPRKWHSQAAPVLPSPFRVGPEVSPTSVSQPSLFLFSMTCVLVFASLPSSPPQLGVLGHHPICAPALWRRCYKDGQSTHSGFDFWLWDLMVCSVGWVPQSCWVLVSTSVKTELMFACPGC